MSSFRFQISNVYIHTKDRKGINMLYTHSIGIMIAFDVNEKHTRTFKRTRSIINVIRFAA